MDAKTLLGCLVLLAAVLVPICMLLPARTDKATLGRDAIRYARSVRNESRRR